MSQLEEVNKSKLSMPQDPSLALVPLTDMGNTGVGSWGPQRNRRLGLGLRFFGFIVVVWFFSPLQGHVASSQMAQW